MGNFALMCILKYNELIKKIDSILGDFDNE